MSVTSVGFSPSTRLESGALFRVTLSNHWYDLAAIFPDAARTLYQSLYQLARVIPTTPLVVLNGSRSAVIDVSLKTSETGSDLLNALDNAGQRFAFVSNVELLTGSDRTNSSGQGGVAARDDAQLTADKKAQESSALNQLLNSFKSLGDVVKWGGVGIAILAVLYFGAPYLSRKK